MELSSVAAPLSSIREDYNGKASGKIVGWGYGVIDGLHSSAQAELVAAMRCVQRLNRDYPRQPIHICSDSTYVTNGLLNPFRMAKNNERYAAYWHELVPICAFTQIRTFHVRGHQKQTFNGLADYICNRVLDGTPKSITRHRINLFNNSKPWRSALIRSHR